MEKSGRNRFELILLIVLVISTVLKEVIQLTSLHFILWFYWVWVISSDALGLAFLVCLGYLLWSHRKAKRLRQITTSVVD